jgi:hypothetical protein
MTWRGWHLPLSLLEWTRSVEPLAQTTREGDKVTTAAQRIRKMVFDDTCPFYLRGWGALHRQGNFGFSHRFMYDPDRQVCTSVPVHGPTALRDGIVDED